MADVKAKIQMWSSLTNNNINNQNTSGGSSTPPTGSPSTSTSHLPVPTPTSPSSHRRTPGSTSWGGTGSVSNNPFMILNKKGSLGSLQGYSVGGTETFSSMGGGTPTASRIPMPASSISAGSGETVDGVSVIGKDRTTLEKDMGDDDDHRSALNEIGLEEDEDDVGEEGVYTKDATSASSSTTHAPRHAHALQGGVE
ncbi:hypothetical protein HDU97_003814 [Phlyctochytrium planicorne]|nr:hypothetical protein HDU97_003814 [Phlyctochytrium planicorne]